jgi:hypothetical protein
MSTPPVAADAAPAFLTVEEAAEILRVNRKTLYEAIRLDQVPGVARHLAMRGIPLTVIKELMGHATIDMTERLPT